MAKSTMSAPVTPTVLAALAGSMALHLLTRPTTESRAVGASRHNRRLAASPSCRVVVVGAGFGGLQAAMQLAGRPGVDLTVIDAHNHHLFQPLLYQVATAALASADIASPVRGIVQASTRVRVLMGEVNGIDAQAREVRWDGGAVRYDVLIIATGSKPSYFGHDEWAQVAPGLKTLDDALDLRRRILTAFERASVAKEKAEKARLLTFVLIGGGATGVEMAGSIAELANDLLRHEYDMTRGRARVVLIEAGPRVLAEFTPDLSQNAHRALTSLGVEIRTGTNVTAIKAGEVHLGGEVLAAETVIWTAGNAATPVAEWLGVKPAKGGRVTVDGDLSVPGWPGVHVIGDAALATDAQGKPLPGLAPVAKQQGQYLARVIKRRLRGRPAPPPFAYRDYGTMATIGRGRAVADFGRVHVTGELAWLTWAVAHIFFLIGFRNRVMVSAQWAFSYLTHERTDRLILGRTEPAAQPPVANPG